MKERKIEGVFGSNKADIDHVIRLIGLVRDRCNQAKEANRTNEKEFTEFAINSAISRINKIIFELEKGV